MFECSYKFELEDSLACTKYVYKSQRRFKDKAIAVMIPILLLAMTVMLIFDIINKKSIVWDCVLLVTLVLLQVLYLLLPWLMKKSQIKEYEKQKLADMDYMKVVVDNQTCIVAIFKDGQEQGKTLLSLKKLTSYIEDNTRLVLVFNELEFVCIKKSNLVGGLAKLKLHLEKQMVNKTLNLKKR